MISSKSLIAPYRKKSRRPDRRDCLKRFMGCERNISIIGISREEEPITSKALVPEIKDRCQTSVGSLETFLSYVYFRSAGQLRLFWASERHMKSRTLFREACMDFIKLIIDQCTLSRDEYNSCQKKTYQLGQGCAMHFVCRESPKATECGRRPYLTRTTWIYIPVVLRL